MKIFNNFKVYFLILASLNLLIVLFFYFNKSQIIPLYKKITRIYISTKQKLVYKDERIKLPSKLQISKKKTAFLEGSFITNLKDDKRINITFIGNSISLSPPNKNNSWDANWGMAATKAELAYPQLLSKSIAKNLNHNVNFKIYNLSSVALKRTYPTNFFNLIKLDESDVLIFQLGDNVKRKNLEYFKKDLETILSKIPRKSCGIITTPFYPDDKKNNLFLQLGIDFNYYVVDLSNIVSASDNPDSMLAKSENFFSNKGVKAHPGNKGMSRIALQILPTIQTCLKNKGF